MVLSAVCTDSCDQEVLEAMGDEPYACPECSELKQARRRHVLDRASRWRGRPRREAAKSVALAVHSMQSPLGVCIHRALFVDLL